MSFQIFDYADKLTPAKKKGRYLCPVCEGNNLTISEDGRYQCWSGCDCRDIREAIAPWSDREQTARPQRNPGKPSKQVKPALLPEGISLTRLLQPATDSPQPEKRFDKQHGEVQEWTYRYTPDKWKTRIQWVDATKPKGHDKTFVVWHKDSSGKAITKAGDGVHPPYRIDEALAAAKASGNNVVVCAEGEKSVEGYRQIGLASITLSSFSKGEIALMVQLLKDAGLSLVFHPDNDDAGKAKAKKVQEACHRAGVPCVVVDPVAICPELPQSGDISETLAAMEVPEFIKRLERQIHRAVKAQGEEQRLNDPDERLKLDLQTLLQESDPIRRMRLRAEIASHHRLNKAEIEQALSELKQRNITPEVQWHSLDDFFDLESEGLRWIIPGLLPVGETIILAGPPKSGKTLLAIDAAFAVATGESTFLKESVEQGKVLIVSVDESANSTKAKLISRGFRRSDAENVQVMTRFDVRQIRVLEERLEVFRPQLVIIDSLKRITHGQEISENSAEFADNLYTLKELLTRYGASGILIHHTSKNQDALGVGKLRGSSAIAGAVWGTWQLDHVPKRDSLAKKLVIDPKDPRRILSVFARDTEGQQIRLELDQENNSWTNYGGVGDSEEWEQERKTLRVRITDILNRNSHKPGLSGREIIGLLGMTPEEGRSVYSELNRMVNKRLLNCRPAPGDKRCNLYSLPNQPPPDGHNDGGKGSGTGGRGSDPAPVSPTPSPPPLPCVPIADYSAETQTQQEFPIVSKLLSNYSADSQQPTLVTTTAEYSNLDGEEVSEIVSNCETKVGREGVVAKTGAIALTQSQPSQAPGRPAEILTCSGHWLRGYFYLGKKGNLHQLADRSGYSGIFVEEGGFRSLPDDELQSLAEGDSFNEFLNLSDRELWEIVLDEEPRVLPKVDPCKTISYREGQ